MKRLALAIGIPSFLLIVIAINLYWLNDAFGDGPPYYSRTTNMDKWSDPRPVLFALDAVAVVVLSYLVHIAGRLNREARVKLPPMNR